jgi:formylglycine-generating enzyme required for sulfatase activity
MPGMGNKHPRGRDPAAAGSGDSDDDKVRLRPVLGIRPGVYLACLYGLAVLSVLFVIFLLPGITKPGVILSVRSEPSGAAVLVDGTHFGAAPCDIFIPRGKHRVEVSLPGFNSRSFESDFGGRLFASRFFPLRRAADITLEARDPAAAFISEAAEFAAWTFAGEPTADYQIPLSLSEGAYRFGPFASDAAVRSSMEGTLSASMGFGVTRAALRDLLRAEFLLGNQGLSPSPVTLLRSAADILEILGETPGAAPWLAETLNKEAAAALSGSQWYTEDLKAARAAVAKAPPAPAQGRAITIGGSGFREIPGGPSVPAGVFPRIVSIERFFIRETAVTQAEWDAFLEARPEWKSGNTESLIKQGLVNSEYLKRADSPGAPTEGLSGVSWYAAGAWCEWFSSQLPPAYAGWEARLPTEEEWEYAAKAAGSAPGEYWEWCGNPFVPLNFFPSLPEAGYSLSPERPVRGGSWINPPGSVNSETRGSLPPSSCSPFVSFRPVLALKKAPPERNAAR